MSRNELAIRGARPMSPTKFKEAEKVRARVIRLRDQMAQGYFEMGRLLHRVDKEHLYRQWISPNGKPYNKFKDYVEQEVDFAFRKARYLMKIWSYFSEELGDPKVTERIGEIGWGKAAALVGVVNSKNVDRWITKARELGVKELADECRLALEAANKTRRSSRSTVEVKKLPETSLTTEVVSENEALSALSDSVSTDIGIGDLGVDPLDDDEKRELRSRWTVMLDGEQRNNVEKAIDTAIEMIEFESDGKGFLLDFIATAFLSMHGGTVGSNDKEHQINFRNQVLRSVEAMFKIDVVAFDRRTMKPLFGEKTIDRIITEADDVPY